ncbi:MAG: ATP-dependent Clp protease ATP-binding subunit [Clostridia bacterium]|nr:ATP-dependent Clp protease ATP-binding subunit [Clostridia bacterium]
MDSQQLKHVYETAEAWVKRYQNSSIGSKHLLLGLIVVPSPACDLLKRYGVNVSNYKISSDGRGFGTVVLEEEARYLQLRARTYADYEDSDLTEPMHLLVAILHTPTCYAHTYLVQMGVDMGKLRSEAISRLTNGEKMRQTLTKGNLGGLEKSVQNVLKEENHEIKYCIDMTQKAQNGEFDPVIGRQEELLRIVQTLLRRTKNNPLLVGEAGVGKSAVIEGLAQAIVQGQVAPLTGKRLLSLDVASMVAGTHYRGDFEQRLKDTIDAITQDGNVILFIDEIHNLVGAGASGDSSMDAVEILKPLLARGQLQTIGATTLDEYRKYIQKDPALDRRFQPIAINQPTEAQTIAILMGVKEKYQQHHKVVITNDAIESAVKLSSRYITDRNLPDKAFDVLDEACSGASLSRKTMVDAQMVSAVVSQWTGVPIGKLSQNEADKLLHLEDQLARRVVGQKEAVLAVAKAIKRQRAGISSPNRPIGSFIFVGPTGVGKTELAKALAESLFGKQDDILRFDMSEYMDKTSVSKLIGVSAGYEGFDEGGVLCEKVRRKPYSLILFDEIEKAHPDVFNVLLQILDEGKLTDNRGKGVDFKNTVIILTSNLGASAVSAIDGYEKLQQATTRALRQAFRPELLNRVDEIIVFSHLSKVEVGQIAKLLCNSLCKRITKLKLTITDKAVQYVADFGYDVEYGARPLKRAIQKQIEDVLAEKFLSGAIKEGDSVTVDCFNGVLFFR